MSRRLRRRCSRTSPRFAGGCKSGTAVALYFVKGGGHTWPGGPQYAPVFLIGGTNRDFSASNVIWDFFKQTTVATMVISSAIILVASALSVSFKTYNTAKMNPVHVLRDE